MGLRHFLMALALFGLPLTVTAQRMNYQSGWNPGVVVLKHNTIIKGEVNYIQKNENVIVVEEKKKHTYHASDIKYFQFFDKKLEYNRAFTPLKRDLGEPFGKIQVFEIVLQGALPYYRKPFLVEKTVVRREKTTSNHVKDDFVEYIYFLKTEDGLVEVKNFKDIFPYLKKHLREINHFIRTNKLDYTLVSGQIQIIDRYNALEEEMRAEKGIN